MPRQQGDSQGDSSQDDDDAAAFAQAVRGVRKLAGPLRVSPVPPPASGARGRPAARVRGSAPVPGGAAPGSTRLAVEDAGESWSARADGVDRRILRKLRSGETPVEARLDLHGLTRSQATRAVDQLIAGARAAGRRCLLVIHGRGLHSGQDGPALRDAVRAALVAGPQAAAVLACCAAPPEMGGPGAVLVLLRR